MTARAIIAATAAALLAVQVVRNADLANAVASRPPRPAALWPGHPENQISSAMVTIAQAAHDGRPVPAPVFAKMARAAARDPLAPEPFLVRGVQAEIAGDGAAAQRAFEAAQWRDPRSQAAAYFLADRYFRTGARMRGLTEVALLSRLSPNGDAKIGPYLAAYAKNPANWPALKAMFGENLRLAKSALVPLASNIATVPAVLAVAPPVKATDATWMAPLLDTLVNAGEYDKARRIWAGASRISPQATELIHDTAFNDNVSPPPFNWALTSSAVGMAERQPEGRLHVVFYGQQDGFLASQLLLLAPGSYRLSMRLLGDSVRARSLNWSIWCDKALAPIASISLDASARGWQFRVPVNCPAQWLKLSGASGDISQQVDIVIGALRMERLAGNA
jgi:hypothetical protein